MSLADGSNPITNNVAANLTHEQTLATSARLLLRALQQKDAEDLFRYRNQPQVSLFQGWTPKDPQEVSDYAREMRTRAVGAPGHWYQVIVEQTCSQKSEHRAINNNTNENLVENSVIGDVAFFIEPELNKQAELGIALDTQYHGKGLAQEAVKALVSFLFTTFELHRIHVSIDTENQASRTLFERVGFRFEGHLHKAVWFKGQWRDDIIMAVLQSEWQG